jgi:hypothetical protein
MTDIPKRLGTASKRRKIAAGVILFGSTFSYAIQNWRTMGPPPVLLLGPPIGAALIGYALGGSRKVHPNRDVAEPLGEPHAQG